MGSPLPAGGALSISLATFRSPFLTGRGAPSSLPHDGPPSRTVSPPPASVTWAGFPLLRLRATSHLHPPGSGPGLGGGALREPLPLRRCGGGWLGVGWGEVCGCGGDLRLPAGLRGSLCPRPLVFSVGLSGRLPYSPVSRRCRSVSSCRSASSLVFPFVEELTLRMCVVVNDC